MKLKFSLPLYAKILVMFLVNVLVIVAGCYAVLRLQFGNGLGTALGRVASERIQSVTKQIQTQLEATEFDQWTKLLKGISQQFDVQISLRGLRDNWLAGDDPVTPPVVKDEIDDLAKRTMARHGRPPPRPPGPRPFGEEEGLGSLFDGNHPPPPHDDGLMEDREDFRPSRLGIFMHDVPESDRHHWVGVLLPPMPNAPRSESPSVLLFASNSITGNGLFFDLKPWLWVVFGAMALSTLLWFPLTRGITHSIRDTMKATEAMTRGNFDVRVDDSRGDELGRLGHAVNQMAVQLDGYVRGQKRFLGDIAHELCSPIARMEMGLGIIENQIPDSQRERLEDVKLELRELSVMVGELLSFSKTAIGMDAKPMERTGLRALVEEAALREAVPLEKLEIDVAAELVVMARSDMLKRAVANVLRNALRHAPESEMIRVEARRRNGHVTLVIADKGPGVPEECLARLFEPFFRVDSARTRESGGTGLGLAIVKSCIEGSGGTVSAKNRPEGGLEIEMQLEAAKGV